MLLTAAGILLLFFGFWTAPLGEIHNSVLVAFGETATFAGALFGVDYKYKQNQRTLVEISPSKNSLTVVSPSSTVLKTYPARWLSNH